MKRFFLFLCCASGWLACRPSNDPAAASVKKMTITEIDPDAPPVYTLEVRKSFTDIPTNISQLCTPDFNYTCARELHELQLELTALNPLPVPQPNTDAPISVQEADKRYRTFAAANQGKPIGVLFQQYFSRIILNKYGLLTSQNYPSIAFYTQQLIESNSYDLVTQARALTILKPHLPAAQFNRLVQIATANASTFLPEHKRLLARRLDDLANPPFEFLYPEEIRAVHKAQFETEDQAVIQAVSRLGQMVVR